MFERGSAMVNFRSYVIAACLALLAGCNIPEPPASLVGAPSNLTATAGDGVVTLTWAASSGATGYTLKRATTSGGPYTQVASPASTGYTDSAVTNGTAYYYVVAARDVGGESANSAQATATPSPPSVPPPVPTNVVATAGNGQVALTWSASSGATGYRVKRSTTSGGPYAQIAAPTSASFTDTSLTNETAYYYVVSAVNVAGESANSPQVTARPVVSNPPPTTFGTWTDVTPPGVDLVSALCSNFGTNSVQADRAQPSNLYAQFHCQGIWKSTDFGLTWNGPINTGTNGALVSQCSGGITVSSGAAGGVPTIYQSCIRGNAIGFWKSVDGGVNWTRYVVAPGGLRQDYYPPVVDPYDENHLLMTGHEFDSTVESTDGGQTWTGISLPGGMLLNGGTPFVFFVDTGVAPTTRGTWLWIAQQAGGAFGTWRTANGGASWARVDTNEHPLGSTQIYQPDRLGAVYMAGANSALGRGVLKSSDYGQTWFHVGLNENETVVFGTPKNVYAMFGLPVGPGGSAPPVLEVGAQPGTGTWVAPGTPAGLTQGPAQVAVVNDGTRNVIVGAMYNSGLWRYVEP